MLHENGSKWLILTPHTGDAQSSSEAVLAAMMGSSCGTERGSRGRWRKPLGISVHGKGLEGKGLERRSGGAGVGCTSWCA